MYDVLDELDCFGCAIFYEQFTLDPLGEFINGHKVVFETALGFLERSYLIQPQQENGQAGRIQIRLCAGT
jgi:hypothetical protein